MLRRTVRVFEKLVIVESPNKVIKVEGLLSDPAVIPDWSFKKDALRRISTGPEKAIAMATTGHFMSLKELTWTPQQISTKPRDSDFPDNGVLASFALEWEIIPGRRIQDTVSHYLEEKADNITEIIIATDPDREGELIAVHALNLVRRMFPKLAVPFTRAYMHSITEDGIRTAMAERRTDFDHDLANAAEARHAMDRIFGFLGSSVVRYANPKMRSIGRVQTPALILINSREERIAKFLEAHQASFQVQSLCRFPGKGGASFTQVVSITPRDGSKSTSEVDWKSEAAVKKLIDTWAVQDAADFHVIREPKTQTNMTEPPKPFTMATLITKANRQLRMSSESVSACLQDLFQMGYITYPRTDSTRVDDSALSSIYDAIKQEHGKALLYRLEDRDKASKKKPTKKSAQRGEQAGNSGTNTNVEDAHEAIRPTNISLTADRLGQISSNTKQLYDLVRRNTLAAFMIPMKTERVSVTVGFKSGRGGEELQFQLEGKHTSEPGWSTAFRSKGNTDAAESDMDAERLEEGEVVVASVSNEEFQALKALKDTLGNQRSAMGLTRAQVQKHRQSPPLPYSEGGLIEELKNNGVGRPSTYPMIVKTLLARNYITVNNGRCETTPVGRMLVETSKTTFPSIVDIGFTSSFEKKLDRIAKPSPSDHEFLKKYSNLTEADYVLSSFVSLFLNYVTEATRMQRGMIIDRSQALKTGGDSGTDSSTAEKDKRRAMDQVPDLLTSAKNYRTFIALQNSLNDYLRRNFPAASPSAWAEANAARASTHKPKGSYSNTKRRSTFKKSK